MHEICQQATYCIGMDTSYKGQCIAYLAIIIQRRELTIYENARPCSANSSFDRELQALCDAVEYATSELSGKVIIIGNNEAALQASVDNSHHSGFALSLQICQLLKH